MPAGKILMSAAILLSGAAKTTKVAHLLNIMQVPAFGKFSFCKIQYIYLAPVINHAWTMHHEAFFSVLSGKHLKLCGDARRDSLGFSAMTELWINH